MFTSKSAVRRRGEKWRAEERTHLFCFRIESVEGPAAFLDILAPPYNIRPPEWAEDQEERDCHYFRELTGPAGPHNNQDQSPAHSWLLMCEPPSSFYCDTEPYRGPEIQSED